MCEAEDVLSIEMTAVKLLAVREHSVHELRKKLASRFSDGELIERVLADLQRRNLLSDERFTEQYVGLRTRKGYGPLRIRAELDERGIASELIEAWLDAGPAHWAAQMRDVARQRFGEEIATDRKEQARRARFLAYRGFPESLIRSYLWD
jgi:regulatory protein